MRLDHLLSKELPALLGSAVGRPGCSGATLPPNARWVVAHGWNIDERALVVRWCQYLRLPAGASPSGGVLVGGCGGTSLVSGSGLVEHTVGSSGHRPPVGGVPGTGRSSDHEPLRRVSSGIGWGRRVWWGSGSLVV